MAMLVSILASRTRRKHRQGRQEQLQTGASHCVAPPGAPGQRLNSTVSQAPCLSLESVFSPTLFLKRTGLMHASCSNASTCAMQRSNSGHTSNSNSSLSILKNRSCVASKGLLFKAQTAAVDLHRGSCKQMYFAFGISEHAQVAFPSTRSYTETRNVCQYS